MFYILLFIGVFLVWKWLSSDTRIIVKGTVNRAGEDTLLATNKGLDLVEDSLELTPEYKKELLERYASKGISKPLSTKK